MSSLAIACILFVGVLTSTLVAMLIARCLPDHHLTGDSKDVIKSGVGIIGTLTALVLGLLVAATKGTYDTQSGTVKDLAAQIAILDRILERYGTDSAEARGRLRDLGQSVLDQIWPHGSTGPIDFVAGQSKQFGESFFEAVAVLDPKTDTQRMLKGRAQEITVGMGQLRQKLVVNSERTIPAPLLIMLAVWQATLFAGLGLLAARNATAITVLIICMVSVAGALFLVLELDRPFEGLVRVSDTPLRVVVSNLGK
ncbi:MAG: hypothetical protein K1X57_01105 [Gemmataceae bacterium]|nr:hypothetical protein [Gemmataceae bacterium]